MSLTFHKGFREPKSNIEKFFLNILFPSFIISLVISALIETGIKLTGGIANLLYIWIVVFIILFFIMLLLKINSKVK